MDAAGGPRGNSEAIQWIIRLTEIKENGIDDMGPSRIVRLCVYDPIENNYFVKITLNNPTEEDVQRAERNLNNTIDKTVAVFTGQLKKSGGVVITNNYKPNTLKPGEKTRERRQVFPGELKANKDSPQPQTQSKSQPQTQSTPQPTFPIPIRIMVATNVAGEKKEIEQIKWVLKNNAKVINRTPEELKARLELLQGYEYTRTEFLNQHPGSTAQQIPFGSGVGARTIPSGFPINRIGGMF